MKTAGGVSCADMLGRFAKVCAPILSLQSSPSDLPSPAAYACAVVCLVALPPPSSLLPTPDCSSFRSKPPPPSCCSRSPMGHQIDDLGAKIKTVSSDPDGAPCLRSYFDSSILTPSGSDCR